MEIYYILLAQSKMIRAWKTICKICEKKTFSVFLINVILSTYFCGFYVTLYTGKKHKPVIFILSFSYIKHIFNKNRYILFIISLKTSLREYSMSGIKTFVANITFNNAKLPRYVKELCFYFNLTVQIYKSKFFST